MLTEGLHRVKALLALSSKLAIRSIRAYTLVGSGPHILRFFGTKTFVSQKGQASHKPKRLKDFQRGEHPKSIITSLYRTVLYDMG